MNTWTKPCLRSVLKPITQNGYSYGLKEKNIGQLAVVDVHDRLVGDIESFAVTDAIIERGNNTTVDEIKRTDDYDIFLPDTDLLEIKEALKEVPVVFIADDNKPVGVIKKGDFFKEHK